MKRVTIILAYVGMIFLFNESTGNVMTDICVGVAIGLPAVVVDWFFETSANNRRAAANAS